jgi:hypothetical protein
MNSDSDGEPMYKSTSKLHWNLVHDPNTSGLVLHELCEVLPDYLLERIAGHPHVEQYTLVRLSMHHDPDVRAAVSENLSTPPDVLAFLLKDESADVRYTMAENHNLAIHLLEQLGEDENPYVSSRAQKTLFRLQEGKCVQAVFDYGTAYEEKFLEGF